MSSALSGRLTPRSATTRSMSVIPRRGEKAVTRSRLRVPPRLNRVGAVKSLNRFAGRKSIGERSR